MNIEKTKKIREAHKAFVYKTMENVEKMLTDGGEDLSSFKEKLTALKSLLTEKMETIKRLDETIPWVSFRGWWGYRRYHGSLSGGGGAIKDTMDLLMRGGRGLSWKPLVSG